MHGERLVSCERGNMYFQGEDIVLRVSGTDSVDLDKAEFTVALNNADYCMKRTKESCLRIGENVYKCVIKSAESAAIPVGTYDIEVLLQTEEERHIAVSRNALIVAKSCFGDE